EDGIRDFHVTGVQTCALPIFGGGDAGDVTEATVDVVGVLQDLPGLVHRVDDLRVVERDLVGVPLVVDLRTGGTQQDVLDEVRGRPAGRVARGDPLAPWHAAVVDDLVGQGDQVVPGLGNLVAVGLERGG